MKKNFITLALAFGALIMTGCSNKPASDNYLQEFADHVNKTEKETGLHVGFYPDFNAMAVTLTLKDSPENNAKICLIGQNEELKKEFREKAASYLEESQILAHLVREKVNFAYVVKTGSLDIEIFFTPAEVKEIAFKK